MIIATHSLILLQKIAGAVLLKNALYNKEGMIIVATCPQRLAESIGINNS